MTECDSTFGCVHCNGRLLVATPKWWSLSGQEMMLLCRFIRSLPKNSASDIPVYLPHASPKVTIKPFALWKPLPWNNSYMTKVGLEGREFQMYFTLIETRAKTYSIDERDISDTYNGNNKKVCKTNLVNRVRYKGKSPYQNILFQICDMVVWSSTIFARCRCSHSRMKCAGNDLWHYIGYIFYKNVRCYIIFFMIFF